MNSIVATAAPSRPALLRNSANSSVAPTPDGVFQEKNLLRFRFSTENRPINERHLSRIVSAIKEKNLLQDFPILVSYDMVIIDGQHRLLAAKQLGIPIFYRIARAADWGDVAAANTNLRKWTISDYLHYWCAKGKPDYLRLKEFVEETQLSLGIAFPILAGFSPTPSSGTPTRKALRSLFHNGEFVITDEDHTREFVSILHDYDGHHSLRREKFIMAVYKVWKDDRYDHARMMEQLETYGVTVQIKNATRVDDYVAQLQNAYNYNRKGRNRAANLGTFSG